MTQRVFDRAIEVFCEHLKRNGIREATISICGSDPLGNMNVIRGGVERFGHEFRGVRLRWIVNSSGGPLGKENVAFFKRHRIEIHLRVDGPLPPALEEIREAGLAAQMNSSMTPDNDHPRKELIDLARAFGIREIYLDRLDSGDSGSRTEGIRRYRELYLYGLEHGLTVSGPWLPVLRNYEQRRSRRDQIRESFWLDVDADGSCAVPLDRSGPLVPSLDRLEEFLAAGGWNRICDSVIEEYERRCDGCRIKDLCYGTAIEAAGAAAAASANCDFFRNWIGFLTKPLFFVRRKDYEIVTIIPLAQLDGFTAKVEAAIAFIARKLWPLEEPIKIILTNTREELVAASRQDFLPDWVKATTGDNVLYHIGADATPHLIHELTHLFLNQRKLRLPEWFTEGVCERLQNRDHDRELLRGGLRSTPLSELSRLLSGEEIMINVDPGKPGTNLLYVQAQAFVDFLMKTLKIDLSGLLLECRYDPLDDVLRKHTGASVHDLLVRFESHARSTPVTG